MTSLRFFGNLGEDAYEFLTSCEESLHNLLLVKFYGVDFFTYQLGTIAMQCWRGYFDSKPGGSPRMTCNQFFDTSLGKYMPPSIHEHLRDKFLALIQVFIMLVEYDLRFYKLSRHATMILPKKYEQI